MTLSQNQMNETLVTKQEKWRAIIVLLSLLLASLTACVTAAIENRETQSRQLAPCPKSPNCVSTKDINPDRTMSPLPYRGTGSESFDRLKAILKNLKGCKILRASYPYIHAEFRSAIFGFIDDVEFLFDDKAKLIHFRSASRVGYYDFGVNRKRMNKITGLYFQGTSSI